MKGRRFVALALVVAALLLLPYSAFSAHRDSWHRPYSELQDDIPEAFFDSDGDLLLDGLEPAYGTDVAVVDTDEDLCPDGVEVRKWLDAARGQGGLELPEHMPEGDADGDGTANVLDADSDDDGLLDGWEFENGLDPGSTHTISWGLEDRFQYYPFYDGDLTDLDFDGMPDDWEEAFSLDDPSGDEDGDGVPNAHEYVNGTDPTRADWLYGYPWTGRDDDGDDVEDSLERVLGLDDDDPDTDGDGVLDGVELYAIRSSPFDVDTDGDGITDGDEYISGSSPIMMDTDCEGLPDHLEGSTDPTVPDTDKDLIPDNEESEVQTDTDGDGLPDVVELASRYMGGSTDPYDPDTDGDGIEDGDEDANRNGRREGNDPTDLVSDWGEGGETDPTMRDTDGGGESDSVERRRGRDPLDPSDDSTPVDPGPDPIPEPPGPEPEPPTPVNLKGLGMVLLVIIVVLLAIVLAMLVYNTAATKEDFLEDVLEALEEGEEVLYSLSIVDDVREAVFQAYRRFLAVMQAYGYTKGAPATAREFSTTVRRAIDLEGEALYEFTDVFELARYSDHELDMTHRDRALAAFAAVREGVRAKLGEPRDRVMVEGEEDGDGAVASGIMARLSRLRGRT